MMHELDRHCKSKNLMRELIYDKSRNLLREMQEKLKRVLNKFTEIWYSRSLYENFLQKIYLITKN